MSEINIRDLLEAGTHFGHQTQRWNPKMRQYIFTERNRIHIIDLQKTVRKLNKLVTPYVMQPVVESRFYLLARKNRLLR